MASPGKLTDFKPLQSLRLPGLSEIKPVGLTVIVGPNSSGKTQLLRDIYGRLTGSPRPYVVAEDIELDKPDVESLLRVLKAERMFGTTKPDVDANRLRPLIVGQADGFTLDTISLSTLESHDRNLPGHIADVNKPVLAFWGFTGQFLSTAQFVESRLASLRATDMIDFQNVAARSVLHALYLNDKAKSIITEEVRAAFGWGLWLDKSRGTIMCLRVNEAGEVPSFEQRESFEMMESYPDIEVQGDGLKAYVTVCLALLLSRRPVTLIDEPELCLHPPKSYALGRFIGAHGADRETSTIVATHSSHILRGILQSDAQVEIIRMTHKEGVFRAHLLSAADLRAALASPGTRSELALDGIFADAVVIVEGHSDRDVYQAVWETLSESVRLDVHFAPVGGVGGIAELCKLYAKLNIPVAVVADLNLLVSGGTFKAILTLMVPDVSVRSALLEQQRQLANKIKALPPVFTEEEAKSRIAAIARSRLDWSEDTDRDLVRQLENLAGDLKRARRIKTGAGESCPPRLAAEVLQLLQALTNHGLFLAPVGQLEDWLAGNSLPPAPLDKSIWSEAALALIQRLGRQPGDIWEFVGDISAYLQNSSRAPAAAERE